MASYNLSSFNEVSLQNYANLIMNNVVMIHKDRFLYSFTDHGEGHSKRMISFCNLLIHNNNQNKLLNQFEKFILFASIWLHDIGIQISNREQIKSFSDEYKLTPPNFENMLELAKYVRDNHHLLSAYWVRQNIAKKKEFISAYEGDDTLGQIVALIIESHGQNFDNLPNYNQILEYKGENINIKLLSAILCLADVIDCDCRRIDPNKISYVDLPQDSRMHWFKHYYVSSVRINKKVICIQYRFPELLNNYEKSLYHRYFQYYTKYWILKIKNDCLHIFRDAEISFELEEDLSQLSNPSLLTLNEDDLYFIEDSCVDIFEKELNDTVVPKKVVIGILKHDGNVLMVNRRIVEGDGSWKLTWQFPAGTMKPEYTEEMTIEKEIKEETGVNCHARKRLGRRIHPNTKVICYYWIVDYIGGSIINGDTNENNCVCWVPLNEYIDKVSSDLYKPIKHYLEEMI